MSRLSRYMSRSMSRDRDKSHIWLCHVTLVRDAWVAVTAALLHRNWVHGVFLVFAASPFRARAAARRTKGPRMLDAARCRRGGAASPTGTMGRGGNRENRNRRRLAIGGGG